MTALISVNQLVPTLNERPITYNGEKLKRIKIEALQRYFQNRDKNSIQFLNLVNVNKNEKQFRTNSMMEYYSSDGKKLLDRRSKSESHIEMLKHIFLNSIKQNRPKTDSHHNYSPENKKPTETSQPVETLENNDNPEDVPEIELRTGDNSGLSVKKFNPINQDNEAIPQKSTSPENELRDHLMCMTMAEYEHTPLHEVIRNNLESKFNKVNHYESSKNIEEQIITLLHNPDWNIRKEVLEMLTDVFSKNEENYDNIFYNLMPSILCNLGHANENVKSASRRLLNLHLDMTTDKCLFLEKLNLNGFLNSDIKKSNIVTNIPNILINEEIFHDIDFDKIIDELTLLSQKNCICQKEVENALIYINNIKNIHANKNYVNNEVKNFQKSYLSNSENGITSNNKISSNYEDENFKRKNNYALIDDDIIKNINNEDNPHVRRQGCDGLINSIKNEESLDLLLPDLEALLLFLSDFAGNHDFSVATISLRLILVLLTKFDDETLNNHLDPMVLASVKVFGDERFVVRSEASKTFHKLLQRSSPEKFTPILCDLLSYKSARARESTLNLLTAGLLTYPSDSFDLALFCQKVLPNLSDSRRRVRQASLENLATIAQCLGNEKLNILTDQIELFEEQSHGKGLIRNAVKARLNRRKLPKYTIDGLIEYALPVHGAHIKRVGYESMHDVAWILKGVGPLSSGSVGGFPLLIQSRHSSWEPSFSNELDNKDLSSSLPQPLLLNALRSKKKRSLHKKRSKSEATLNELFQDERGPFALWSSESIDLSRTAPPEFGGYRGLYIGKLRQRSASLNRSLNADKGYALLPNKYASGGVGSARANERRVLGSSPIKSPSRKLNSLQPLDTGDGYTAFPYAPSRASRIPPLKSPSKCSSVTKTLKTHHDLSYASFESNEDGTSDKSDIDEDVNEEEINEHREAIIKGSGHRTSATSEDLRNRNLSLEANEEATQPKTDQNVVAKNTVVLSAAQKEQQLEEDQPEEEEEEDVSDNREEQEQEDEEDFDENNYEIDLVEQARRFSLHGRNSYNHNGLTIRGGGRGSTNSLPISFGQQRGKNLFTKSNKNGPYFGSRNRKPIFKGRENHPDYFNYESDFESEDEDGKLDKRNNKNIARHDRRLTDREAREHRIRKYRELELRHSGNSLQITDPNQDPKIRFSRSRSSPRVSPQPVRKGVNISKSRSHDQNLNRKSRLDRERSHSSEKLNGYSKTVFSRSPSQDQRRLGRKTGSNPTIGFPSRYNDPVSSRRSTPGIGLDRGVARSTSVLSEENIPTAAFQNSNENYTAIQGRNFKPFPSAKDAFQSAMELLRGSDWEEQVDGIQSMARLAVFHPETLQRDLKEINAMLMKHAKNLRSQVSRAAIQAIMLFLDFLKKAMEQDLDKIVSLLLHKTSDTNKFIKEDTNTSLDMVVEVITPAKAVATIIQEGINHKNPLVRTTVARLLAYSCERIGSDKVLNQREVAEKMLPALTRLVQEGSLETRRYSKMAFQRLSFNKNFESTLKKNIPGDELRNIQKVLDSLQQSENRDVRENARYRDAKGGAAPRIRR